MARLRNWICQFWKAYLSIFWKHICLSPAWAGLFANGSSSPPRPTPHFAQLCLYLDPPHNYPSPNSCLCCALICFSFYLVSICLSTYLCVCFLESAFQHRNCWSKDSSQLFFTDSKQHLAWWWWLFWIKCTFGMLYIWLVGKYLQSISMFAAAASVNSCEKRIACCIQHFPENGMYHPALQRHLRKFKVDQTLSGCNWPVD